MMICHPEILRAERIGGGKDLEIKGAVCDFCGTMLFENEFVCDIVGGLFCSNECREKKFYRRKGRT